jgi:glycosyltransferase involved in cell wall biosynthesis
MSFAGWLAVLERRRSVLLVSQPVVAGVAQCVLDWGVGLADRGWAVSVACPPEGWLGERCAEAGLTVHTWRSVRAPHRGVAGEYRALRGVLRDADPEVVFLNSSKAGLVGRLLVRGRTPTAFSPHSWSYEAANAGTARAALAWERWAARWTHTLICVSDGERSEGIMRGISAPYVVARNGVDTAAIRPVSTLDRQALRSGLGIHPDTAAVVCVGRLQMQKGQDVLIAAWPEVTAGHAVLYLLGDGPDAATLRAMTDRADVVFVGNATREAALDWMAAADLVVVPSRWEGMALVPLESMALGTPVVASDVTGLREALDPSFGTLVPPEDPAVLAQAISAWLSLDSEAISEARIAARERAELDFDLNRTVDTVSGALAALVDN